MPFTLCSVCVCALSPGLLVRPSRVSPILCERDTGWGQPLLDQFSIPCPSLPLLLCMSGLWGRSDEVRTACWLAQCRLRSRVAPSSESCPGCSRRTLHQLRTLPSETFICSRGNLALLAESLLPGRSLSGLNPQWQKHFYITHLLCCA